MVTPSTVRSRGRQTTSCTSSRGAATALSVSEMAENRRPRTWQTTSPCSLATCTSTVSCGDLGERTEWTVMCAGGSPLKTTDSMCEDIHWCRAYSGVTSTALMVSAPSMTCAQLVAVCAGGGTMTMSANCSSSLRRSSTTSQGNA